MGKITRAQAEQDAAERKALERDGGHRPADSGDVMCPKCGAEFAVPPGRPQASLCVCGWLLLVTPHPFGGMTADDVMEIVPVGEENLLARRLPPILDRTREERYAKQHARWLEGCRRLQEKLVAMGKIKVWRDGDRAGLKWIDTGETVEIDGNPEEPDVPGRASAG